MVRKGHLFPPWKGPDEFRPRILRFKGFLGEGSGGGGGGGLIPAEFAEYTIKATGPHGNSDEFNAYIIILLWGLDHVTCYRGRIGTWPRILRFHGFLRGGGGGGGSNVSGFSWIHKVMGKAGEM